MSRLNQSLFIMDGDNIRPVIDGKYFQMRDSVNPSRYITMRNTASLAEIENTNSHLYLIGAGDVALQPGSGHIMLKHASSANNMLDLAGSTDTDQFLFAVGDPAGNQILVTNFDNRSKDHDVPVQADPLWGIFSDTNPDTDNTQSLFLWHDKADAHIQPNKGSIVFGAEKAYDGTFAAWVDLQAELAIKAPVTLNSQQIVFWLMDVTNQGAPNLSPQLCVSYKVDAYTTKHINLSNLNFLHHGE